MPLVQRHDTPSHSTTYPHPPPAWPGRLPCAGAAWWRSWTHSAPGTTSAGHQTATPSAPTSCMCGWSTVKHATRFQMHAERGTSVCAWWCIRQHHTVGLSKRRRQHIQTEPGACIQTQTLHRHSRQHLTHLMLPTPLLKPSTAATAAPTTLKMRPVSEKLSRMTGTAMATSMVACATAATMRLLSFSIAPPRYVLWSLATCGCGGCSVHRCSRTDRQRGNKWSQY